jgi:WD40 repeat protein
MLKRRNRIENIARVDFSPDGSVLAAASNDNFIDLYDVAKDYKRFAVCKGHSTTQLQRTPLSVTPFCFLRLGAIPTCNKTAWGQRGMNHGC